jgi:hypothetical protein
LDFPGILLSPRYERRATTNITPARITLAKTSQPMREAFSIFRPSSVRTDRQLYLGQFRLTRQRISEVRIISRIWESMVGQNPSESIRGPRSTAISNRQITRLEPHLSSAKSISISFLIAKILTNRISPFFTPAEARQRHLKSSPQYAYLSRHIFGRQRARRARRERAAGVFGLNSRSFNRFRCRLEFDATHCKQTTDANSDRRKTGT